MRGKVLQTAGILYDDRITPAYAGKRTARFIRKTPFWDHPRLCGEKYEKSPPVDSMKGSPPPMRGKVYKPLKIKIHCRITPAYAGKSHR